MSETTKADATPKRTIFQRLCDALRADAALLARVRGAVLPAAASPVVKAGEDWQSWSIDRMQLLVFASDGLRVDRTASGSVTATSNEILIIRGRLLKRPARNLERPCVQSQRAQVRVRQQFVRRRVLARFDALVHRADGSFENRRGFTQ